ncbi:MAG: Ig-like domain-containing protein, partial [Anaerolineaceae bacterium]|nr:Ig-like domain-containing protein [Anaerolineaceae bacterium]
MKSNQQKLILFLSLGSVGCIILLAAAAGWFYLTQGAQSEPTIHITFPSDHTVVASGEDIILVCQARAENSIQRIDMLLNDVLAEQYFPQSADKTSLQTSFTWFTSSPGIHKLSVIAYDQRGQASPPDHLVVGVALNPPTSEEIIIPPQNAIAEQSGEAIVEEESESGEEASGDASVSESEEGAQVSGQDEEQGDEISGSDEVEDDEISESDEEEGDIVENGESFDLAPILILNTPMHFPGM